MEYNPDEWKIEHIKLLADDVRKKLVGGTLFGVYVDGEDEDILLAMAYMYGRVKDLIEVEE